MKERKMGRIGNDWLMYAIGILSIIMGGFTLIHTLLFKTGKLSVEEYLDFIYGWGIAGLFIIMGLIIIMKYSRTSKRKNKMIVFIVEKIQLQEKIHDILTKMNCSSAYVVSLNSMAVPDKDKDIQTALDSLKILSDKKDCIYINACNTGEGGDCLFDYAMKQLGCSDKKYIKMEWQDCFTDESIEKSVQEVLVKVKKEYILK